MEPQVNELKVKFMIALFVHKSGLLLMFHRAV